MVIPRRQAEDFSNLTQDEASHVMLSAQTTARSVRESFQPDGINIIQSNGDAASQSIPVTFICRSSSENLVAGPGMVLLPCYR